MKLTHEARRRALAHDVLIALIRSGARLAGRDPAPETYAEFAVRIADNLIVQLDSTSTKGH